MISATHILRTLSQKKDVVETIGGLINLSRYMIKYKIKAPLDKRSVDFIASKIMPSYTFLRLEAISLFDLSVSINVQYDFYLAKRT